MAQTFRTAISFDGLASASSQALAVKVNGDSENRILIDAGGKITWGAGGSSAGDTTLYRNAANVLKTDDGFVAASVTVPDSGLTLGSTAVTSTAAELNILDGVTSTAAELNILDGVTSTAAELNLVDGITAGTVSASLAVIVDSSKDVTGFRNVTLTGELDAATLDISGDADIDGTLETDALSINGTAVTSTAAELNILDGVTSTAAELNILDGVTSTAAELNILDGVTSTAAELNLVDGITAGTISASKAVIVDSNKDLTGFRNVTLTGELDAATLDISGNADIDGTTNLDAVDIDGAVQIDGAVTVGVDDTGVDVKFFGATSGKYMLWDESADALIVKDTVDAVNFKVNGGQGSDGQVLTSTGSGVAWEDASGGGGASVTISDSAPGSPSAGNLWFESDTGKTFIYYGDGSSNQWVEVGSASATTGGANTQVQYNSSGSLAGNANFVYDGSSLITMTKSGANTGIKLDVASDTEAHSGNIAFYKSEAAGAGRLDKDAVYGQIDFYGQTASNGYHHAAAIKTLVGDYFYSDNYTPSDIEFWATPADQTSPIRRLVVRGGTANTDAGAVEIWHNGGANKGGRVDFVDDDGTQLGYFGYANNSAFYIKNNMTAANNGNIFLEAEGDIYVRARGEYEVLFNNSGIEPYADEGYKLGASNKEWSEAYIVDLKISGNSTMTGTLTVGVDDTGHDVKFYGAGAGDHLLWDESEGRLDVVATSGAAYFRSLNGTTTTYIGSDSGNTALFGTSSAHDTRFIVNDAERMRMTTTHDIRMLGTGSATGAYIRFMDSGSTELSYVGSPGNDDLHLKSSAAAGYLYMAAGGNWKFYSANSSTGGFLPYSDDTFDLGASGARWDDVYATNGTIQTSDVNLKKDITDATLGLNFIKALRPVEYKWKGGSRKHQGFIAQEVKTVLDAQADSAEQSMWGLNTVKEGTKVMRPIADENDIPEDTEVDNEPRQSLRYTEIIAPLVKAVQELTTRLEALESA
jgi:cytoskeletal protein CcmA (bactofilin family)